MEACRRSLGDREELGMDVEVDTSVGRSCGDGEDPDTDGDKGRSKYDDET